MDEQEVPLLAALNFALRSRTSQARTLVPAQLHAVARECRLEAAAADRVAIWQHGDPAGVAMALRSSGQCGVRHSRQRGSGTEVRPRAIFFLQPDV